jgi:hypothetical protein
MPSAGKSSAACRGTTLNLTYLFRHESGRASRGGRTRWVCSLTSRVVSDIQTYTPPLSIPIVKQLRLPHDPGGASMTTREHDREDKAPEHSHSGAVLHASAAHARPTTPLRGGRLDAEIPMRTPCRCPHSSPRGARHGRGGQGALGRQHGVRATSRSRPQRRVPEATETPCATRAARGRKMSPAWSIVRPTFPASPSGSSARRHIAPWGEGHSV